MSQSNEYIEAMRNKKKENLICAVAVFFVLGGFLSAIITESFSANATAAIVGLVFVIVGLVMICWRYGKHKEAVLTVQKYEESSH